MAANLLYCYSVARQSNPFGSGTLRQQKCFLTSAGVCHHSLRWLPSPATRQRSKSIFDAYNKATVNNSIPAQQRAEPITRPCSFALDNGKSFPIYKSTPSPQEYDCGSRSGDRTWPKRSPSNDVKHRRPSKTRRLAICREPVTKSKDYAVTSMKQLPGRVKVTGWLRPMRSSHTTAKAWG